MYIYMCMYLCKITSTGPVAPTQPLLPLYVPTIENLPSDSMSNPASLPPLIEGYGRKRKKRTSIETNIKLTLEKRFLDVSLTLQFLSLHLWNCCAVYAKFWWLKEKLHPGPCSSQPVDQTSFFIHPSALVLTEWLISVIPPLPLWPHSVYYLHDVLS